MHDATETACDDPHKVEDRLQHGTPDSSMPTREIGKGDPTMIEGAPATPPGKKKRLSEDSRFTLI